LSAAESLWTEPEARHYKFAGEHKLVVQGAGAAEMVISPLSVAIAVALL
jgi:hypothetical protein